MPSIIDFPNEPIPYVMVIVTVLIIYLIYRLVEFRWPDFYFSSTNKSGAIFVTNVQWYFLFRFAPVLLTVTVLLSFIKDGGFNTKERIATGLLIGILYGIITDLKAISDILRSSASIEIYYNKYAQLLHHIFSFFAILITTCLGGYLSSLNIVQDTTPTLEGIKDNVWSSFIIALFLVIFRSVYHKIQNIMNSTDIYASSFRKIDERVFKKIDEFSDSYNADPKLVKAICIVENLQRPLWFRRLEYLKSFLIKKGSYGIMQFPSNKYISDFESIELAIKNFFSNTAGADYDEVRDRILKYNNSIDYANLVMDCYGRQ